MLEINARGRRSTGETNQGQDRQRDAGERNHKATEKEGNQKQEVKYRK